MVKGLLTKAKGILEETQQAWDDLMGVGTALATDRGGGDLVYEGSQEGGNRG